MRQTYPQSVSSSFSIPSFSALASSASVKKNSSASAKSSARFRGGAGPRSDGAGMISFFVPLAAADSFARSTSRAAIVRLLLLLFVFVLIVLFTFFGTVTVGRKNVLMNEASSK